MLERIAQVLCILSISQFRCASRRGSATAGIRSGHHRRSGQEDRRRYDRRMSKQQVERGRGNRQHARSLVYYERMNHTQSASARIAVDKASAAAMYRRPTRAFVDAIAKTGPATMTLPGVVASPGGLPIFSGGKVIGGSASAASRAIRTSSAPKPGLQACHKCLPPTSDRADAPQSRQHHRTSSRR